MAHDAVRSPGLVLLLLLGKDTHLSVFEVLLELLLHGSQLLGLHPAVGQQHATKLSLSNSPIHRVVTFKLKGKHSVLVVNGKDFDRNVE